MLCKLSQHGSCSIWLLLRIVNDKKKAIMLDGEIDLIAMAWEKTGRPPLLEENLRRCRSEPCLTSSSLTCDQTSAGNF